MGDFEALRSKLSVHPCQSSSNETKNIVHGKQKSTKAPSRKYANGKSTTNIQTRPSLHSFCMQTFGIASQTLCGPDQHLACTGEAGHQELMQSPLIPKIDLCIFTNHEMPSSPQLIARR